MRRTQRRTGRGEDPGQLQIEWNRIAGGGRVVTTSPLPASVPATDNVGTSDTALPSLVQRLPWDFQSTFPQPTPEAIDAGVVSDEDAAPENVRAIHEEHTRELLMVLHDLDAVLDARRLGIDPATGKPPRTDAAKDRLLKLFATEPGRLERWWQTLMDTYEEAFGSDAADAFGKALRARHAGISVIAEESHATTPPAVTIEETPVQPRIRKQVRHEPRRITARLLVARPLPSAVAAGHFGQDDRGRPIRPGAHEVREITRRHAEKLIDILDSIQQASGSCVPSEASRLRKLFAAGLSTYTDSFGQDAADQLEAYIRRQAALDPSSRHER
jgi:hypothetical protein